MSKYNLAVKRNKEKSFLIEDMIATKLSESMFNKLKDLNPEKLGDYSFMPYKDTDFSWWLRISKKLTPHKIYSGVRFDCDSYGNISEY